MDAYGTGEIPLAKVTPLHIEQLLQERSKKVSAKTMLNELGLLQSIFSIFLPPVDLSQGKMYSRKLGALAQYLLELQDSFIEALIIGIDLGVDGMREFRIGMEFCKPLARLLSSRPVVHHQLIEDSRILRVFGQQSFQFLDGLE